jgi:hypothetical protein
MNKKETSIVKKAVRQGYPLSPILCNIYIYIEQSHTQTKNILIIINIPLPVFVSGILTTIPIIL